MKTFLWSCAGLLTLLVTVECLTCYTCDVDLVGSCLHETHVNCTSSQNRCYKAVANFSADLLNIHARGCIEEAACVNQTGSILNVNYSITRYCCTTDLCNGAASIQLPLTTALCAALVVVWSQWGL